jgi:hypothetical protein
MNDETRSNDLVQLWQDQVPEGFHLSPKQIQERIENMEKQARRAAFDFYLATGLSAIATLFLAAAYGNLTMQIGAGLLTAGGLYMAWRVRQSRKAMDALGDTSTVDVYRRAAMAQLELHRKKLWKLIAIWGPGGLMFFIGFAQSRPDLKFLIYPQFVILIFALAVMIPLNRRHAVKYERRLEELDRLKKEPQENR